MREAEQRLTEEQETMLGLQVALPFFSHWQPQFLTPFFGFSNFGGYWVENE